MRFLPRALVALTATALAVPVTTVTSAQADSADSRPRNVPKTAIKVEVKKVIDAETVDVVTSKGVTTRIGLLDADAPDPEECWYKGALATLTKLLPVNKAAYLQVDRGSITQNGRYLLYVWSSTGVFVNATLVRNGYAQAVPSYPEHRHTDWMFQVQLAAQVDLRGMWSGACWAADTYDQRGAVAIPPAARELVVLRRAEVPLAPTSASTPETAPAAGYPTRVEAYKPSPQS